MKRVFGLCYRGVDIKESRTASTNTYYNNPFVSMPLVKPFISQAEQKCTPSSRGYMATEETHLKHTPQRLLQKVRRSRPLVNLSLYCQSLYPGEEDSLLLSADLYFTFLMRMTRGKNTSPDKKRQWVDMLHKQRLVLRVFLVQHWEKLWLCPMN